MSARPVDHTCLADGVLVRRGDTATALDYDGAPEAETFTGTIVSIDGDVPMLDLQRKVGRDRWHRISVYVSDVYSTPLAALQAARARAAAEVARLDGEIARERGESFCACGRVTSQCDGSRAGCQATSHRPASPGRDE